MNAMMVVLAAGEPEQTLLKAGELAERARQIQRLAHGSIPDSKIQIVLTGKTPEGLAAAIADNTGEAVTAMPLPESASWDLLGRGLEVLAARICPALVVFAHTAMAREAGPGLAVALGGISVSNVCAVDRNENGFSFTRPVMDNTRTQAVQVPDGHLCVISLAPGAGVARAGEALSGQKLSDPKLSGGGCRLEVFHPPAFPGTALKRLSLASRSGSGNGKLSRAPIVVAAGRGIGEPENLDRVRAFAACFPGAATAASRPLVDQGWVGYDRQVGITGAVVSPELYIALGISGSSQHLAGMAGSKWVISVNKSPDAPICRHSDLCIQGDVTAFMDAVLEKQHKK